MREPVEIVHPIPHAKPKIYVASVERKGGRLAGECGCGWYCLHNHKSVDAGYNCVEKHRAEIQDA